MVHKMYGLILENLAQYTIMVYGEEKWEEIRRQAKIELPAFSTHQVYPDYYFWRLSNKACKVSPHLISPLTITDTSDPDLVAPSDIEVVRKGLPHCRWMPFCRVYWPIWL